MQTIYLDISNKGVVPTVYAKQNDVGRKFAVILTDSGLPYIPEIGSVFSVWYKGASGEGNYTDIGDKSAFSLNGNKVEVEMIVQMLSAHGDGILCMTLNSPDGNQISSWNIPYMCEIVPGSESEKAEEYYTAFSESVEKLKQVTENLTPEAIGAAPAGYGLGGNPGENIINSTAALNALYANCFFVFAGGTGDPVPSSGHTINYGYGHMEAYSDARAKQTLIPISPNHASTLVRYMRGGVWDEWGWKNPPMELGVEYRTTERWNGKAVYCKTIDFGSLPDSASASVAHGITGKTENVRHLITATNSSRILTTHPHIEDVIVDDTSISVRTNASLSYTKALYTLWYTKD